MRYSLLQAAAFSRKTGEARQNASGADLTKEHASARRTVLLASGDSHELKMWAAHLANLDCRLQRVENGEEALRTILATRIDAVIAAVTMDKLDGLELLRALGGLSRPPVTLLVAQGGSDIDKVYLKIAKLYGALPNCTRSHSTERLSARACATRSVYAGRKRSRNSSLPSQDNGPQRLWEHAHAGAGLQQLPFVVLGKNRSPARQCRTGLVLVNRVHLRNAAPVTTISVEG